MMGMNLAQAQASQAPRMALADVWRQFSTVLVSPTNDAAYQTACTSGPAFMLPAAMPNFTFMAVEPRDGREWEDSERQP